MKAHAIVASLLTFAAYGATAIRFDGGRSNDGRRPSPGEQPIGNRLQLLNDDSGLSFSQERTYDRSDSDADSEFNYNGAVECAPGTPWCADGSGKNDRRPNEDEAAAGDDRDGWWYEGNSDYWSSYGQSGRSAESLDKPQTSETPSGDRGGNAVPFGADTVGWRMVRKMAAMDAIVAGGGNLLDVESPLPVKKSAVKVTKSNYVSFRAARVDGMDGGRLEYLSVDVANDAVYVECAFDRLTANGTFKTNMRHARRGQFAAHISHARSNVTASFHKGRAAIRPAAFGAIATRVWTDSGGRQDAAAAVERSVDERYRDVLARAVSAEVYNSTHKGAVARLKAEAGAAFDASGTVCEPFDRAEWTDGELSVRVNAAAADPRPRRTPARVRSASYTRLRPDDAAYRMRFDVHLDALRWTGDVAGTWKGRPFRAPDARFDVDRAEVRVVVVKSAGGRACRSVDAQVRTRGFRHALDSGRHRSAAASVPGASSSSVDDDADAERALDRELSGFVRRSFEASLRSTVRREMCDGRLIVLQ